MRGAHKAQAGVAILGPERKFPCFTSLSGAIQDGCKSTLPNMAEWIFFACRDQALIFRDRQHHRDQTLILDRGGEMLNRWKTQNDRRQFRRCLGWASLVLSLIASQATRSKGCSITQSTRKLSAG